MEQHVAACHCGQLRLTCEGPPLHVSLCHCLCCQQRTGSAFGLAARFATSNVAIEGRFKSYSRTGDEGHRATFGFCPECGSNVFWRADEMPELTAVAVGCFADPNFPAPLRAVYEDRQHPWTKHLADREMERYA